METFEVGGSHGTISALRSNGKIVDGPKEGEYADISQFDVEEFRHYYKEDIPEYVDILDLGYWTKNGVYEPPVQDWRDEFRKSQDEHGN